MRKKLFLFVAVLPYFMVTAQQAKITNAVISFEFVNKEVKGTIAGFQSTSKLDWNNMANSFFEGSVAVETLDTNNGLRNWSLKSGKYFDKNDYPRIYFKSNNLKLEKERLIVQGVLTLKGIQKPLTITFKRNGKSLVGYAELYSYDFDIKVKKKREDNLVKVTFRFEQQ